MLKSCCFCIPLNTAAHIIGVACIIASIVSIIDLVHIKRSNRTQDFSYALLTSSNIPAAIFYVVMLFKPTSLVVKKRFAISYIVSGTVGIISGYAVILDYTIKNQADG